MSGRRREVGAAFCCKQPLTIIIHYSLLIIHYYKFAGGLDMAKKKGGNTVAEVSALVEPIVNGLGLQLWDVRYVKEGALWYLRIFIDKPEGVTIEDCENVTRAVDAPLDELDPIDGSYTLEVSSPGIERELLRDEHFEQFLGAPVMIKMHKPLEDGTKELTGTLISHDKDSVEVVADDGREFNITKKDTVYIKLNDFNIYS